MPKASRNPGIITRIRRWRYTNFIAVAILSVVLALTIFAINQKGITTTRQQAAEMRIYGTPYSYPYPNPPRQSCTGSHGTCINSNLCRNNCTNPPPGAQECGRYNCPTGQSCCF